MPQFHRLLLLSGRSLALALRFARVGGLGGLVRLPSWLLGGLLLLSCLIRFGSAAASATHFLVNPLHHTFETAWLFTPVLGGLLLCRVESFNQVQVVAGEILLRQVIGLV